jgi:hypothetical protein
MNATVTADKREAITQGLKQGRAGIQPYEDFALIPLVMNEFSHGKRGAGK